jgi:septal ring factor EnvC (AmiA/AmiB activator)
VYQDAQTTLYNALSRLQNPSRTRIAVRAALVKFEQVQSGHRYADDFKQVCRELLGRLEGGHNEIEALLAATRQMSEREAMHTEALQSRIAELEEMHKEAQEERRREVEARKAAERARDWRLPENWPGMLMRTLPSLLGGKGLGLVLSVLLLKPCQHAVCASEMLERCALASGWSAWVWNASCAAREP